MKIITTWIWLMSVISVYGKKVCKTEGGNYCRLPFSYYWEHNICTQWGSYYQPKPWCYLNTTSWDYCTNDCFECGVSNNVQTSCNMQREEEGVKSNLDFPWHVHIKQRKPERIICNGVIISSSRVLTTATCLKKFEEGHVYDVYAGSSTRFPGNGFQVVWVVKHFIHPGYNATSLENDIAIMELSRGLTWNDRVLPICYSKSYSLVSNETNATFTGSRIIDGVHSTMTSIHYSIVHLIPNQADECKNEGLFCTSRNTVDDRDPENDGGPLTICQDSKCVLVGVLSRSKYYRNALIFTNVTMFVDWIDEST